MKVAVTGWYGHGNLGDELLAYSTLRSLERNLPSPRLTLLTEGRPATELSNYPTCRPIHAQESIKSARGAARIARHTVLTGGRWPRLALGLDMLVVGGGSLFHDRQRENLLMWKETLSLYKSLGSAVALYGVTIDEVSSPEARADQHALLRLADSISVRDPESATLVSDLIGPEKVVLAADPVLGCELLPSNVPGRLPRRPPVVGFNMRPLRCVPTHVIARHGASVVESLLERLGARIVFLPMGTGDAEIGREIGGLLTSPENYSVLPHDSMNLAEHVRLYENFDVVIAMRLHALVLGVANGVPALGLRYDSKVESFLAEVGLSNYGVTVSNASGSEWYGLDSRVILDLVDRLLGEWAHTGPRTRRLLQELRNRERRNVESVMTMARGTSGIETGVAEELALQRRERTGVRS